jgi:hypothetical protein
MKSNLVTLFTFILFCTLTACSKNDKVTYKVGQSYGGGIVAYVDSSGQHGLIAASLDQTINSTSPYYTGTGIMWQVGTFTGNSTVFDVTNAIGVGIGAGKTNTSLIIAKQTSTGRPFAAAAIAVAYNGGGFSDWVLPSKGELNQLYVNRVAIGGFESARYWSSTEKNEWYAESLDFATGNFDSIGGYKGPGGTPYKVRAVRYF